MASADVTVGGSVALTSDYVLRGVSQSGGDPALQADIHARLGSAWSAGLWASEVHWLPRRRSPELDAYVQWRAALDADVDLAVQATHYAYPRDPRPTRYDYDELSVTAGWRDAVYLALAIAPAVTLYSAYTGDLARHHEVMDGALSVHRTLSPRLDATLGLGYYDPVGLDYAAYAYGSVGLELHYDKWLAHLALIQVQGSAHRQYTPGPAGGPLTLTLARRF